MDKPKSNGKNEVVIEGDISGQVAIGNNINQQQTIHKQKPEISLAELEVLKKLFVELRGLVATSATPDHKEKALEKVSELEEAITAQKPDITTMEYVKNWFGKNLPQLAGAVTGLVVNPIVGKLVEAAGETVAHEFKRRFGSEV